MGRMAYRMRLEPSAATPAQAQALVSARLELPDGWVAGYEVVPADGSREPGPRTSSVPKARNARSQPSGAPMSSRT